MDRFLRKIAVPLAALKVIGDRQRGYLSWIQFFMICYLFLAKSGFKLYYLLIIPILFLWAWFDKRYIIREELDYLQRKSRILSEMREALKNK